MRIRRTNDVRKVLALDAEIFPDDDPVDVWDQRAAWWVAGSVAFAGARLIHGEPVAYLLRAGVVAGARGQGMQRRLIRARVAWAVRESCEAVITYTSPDNCPSANNLAACGFKLYAPSYRWVGDALYWIREL